MSTTKNTQLLLPDVRNSRFLIIFKHIFFISLNLGFGHKECSTFDHIRAFSHFPAIQALLYWTAY